VPICRLLISGYRDLPILSVRGWPEEAFEPVVFLTMCAWLGLSVIAVPTLPEGIISERPAEPEQYAASGFQYLK
jgi:hypothetical protein